MTQTAKERFTEAKRKMLEQQEAAREVARQAFREGAQELFDAHPKLQRFSWMQYTPYFNDGEECVFSAGTDYPMVNGVGEDDENEDEFDGEEDVDVGSRLKAKIFGKVGTHMVKMSKLVDGQRVEVEEEQDKYGYVPNPNYDPELGFEEVKAFLAQFDDDDYLGLFGDHHRVTVKRDGAIDITDYSHD